MNEWIVQLKNPVASLCIEIFIFRRSHPGKVDILRADGSIETIDNNSSSVKPTLFLEPDMLQGLVEALNERNIKPKDSGEIAGKLIAQSAHLEDLQKLLKLKK